MKEIAYNGDRCLRSSTTPNRGLPLSVPQQPKVQQRRKWLRADSDLGLAQSTLKRYQNLYDKKSVSPQEFDEVKARYQAALAHRDMTRAGQAQAKAALTQAHTSFSYTRILAPFDGVITEKKADPGTLASPGLPDLHSRGLGPLPIGSYRQRERSSLRSDGRASAGHRGRTGNSGPERKNRTNRRPALTRPVAVSW